MKLAVFWVLAPFSLEEVYDVSEGLLPPSSGPQRPDYAGIKPSETLVNFYQTTRLYNPEDSHLRIICIAEL
jgi:hypothetical protein